VTASTCESSVGHRKDCSTCRPPASMPQTCDGNASAREPCRRRPSSLPAATARRLRRGALVKEETSRSLDILMLLFYHQDVRTTLTLDDDVAAKLAAETARSGRPFRVVVNETLRLGLVQISQRSKKGERFEVRPRSLGIRPGLSYDNIEELLDEAEGGSRR